MARVHEIGTPTGAERKLRRVGSPLQEMDGMTLEKDEDEDQETWTRQPRFDVEPQTPPAPHPELTLEAIGLLLKSELTPMRTKVESLDNNMAELNISVDNRFRDLKRYIDEKVEQKHRGDATPDSNQSWASKLTLLEREIDEMKKGDGPVDDAELKRAEYDRTLVIGGLGSLRTLDDAKELVSDKLWEAYGPTQQDMHCKGEFKGILFTKFTNTVDRDEALRLLRDAFKTSGYWVKPDKPIETRVLQAVIFGTKRNLSVYYDKKEIWGDIREQKGEGELWLSGDLLFTASVGAGVLTMEYADGVEGWLLDDAYPEFKETIDAVKEKMAASKKGAKGKGKSKGKQGMNSQASR